MKKIIFFLIVLTNSKTILAMGGSTSDPKYRKNAVRRSDQPNYHAKVKYKEDDTTIEVEGFNINRKTVIKNAALIPGKGKKNKKHLIKTNIRFKGLEKIHFYDEKEGLSIKGTVTYKSGTSQDYLFDEDILFGGFIIGTNESNSTTLEIGQIREIEILGFYKEKGHKHGKMSDEDLAEIQNVLDADKPTEIKNTNDKPKMLGLIKVKSQHLRKA